MKAMIVNTYGESALFEAAQIDNSNVQPGHVLVKIAATSVNTVDTMIRQMGEALPISPALPAILGMDFAGTIEEVGEVGKAHDRLTSGQAMGKVVVDVSSQ